jgi:SAM-dependent methyltransferase
MTAGLLDILRDRLPPPVRQKIRQRLQRLARPAWLHAFNRTTPLSRYFGNDRGTPVDRHYIEAFLEQHRADIRGDCLEVKDSKYLDRFGSGVTHVDVLDIDASNPEATLVSDLAAAETLPENRFDCIVLTQTLQYVFDLAAAVRNLHRMLRPGGVLLVTAPSAIALLDPQLQHLEHWRFTVTSCRRLFAAEFGQEAIDVRAYGNMLTARAFLAGMASEELSPRHLAAHDPLFPVVVSVRAVKAR